MNNLITLAGALIISAILGAFMCAETLISYLVTNINWSAVLVIGISILVITTFTKRKPA